jgi:hypothetical protein
MAMSGLVVIIRSLPLGWRDALEKWNGFLWKI